MDYWVHGGCKCQLGTSTKTESDYTLVVGFFFFFPPNPKMLFYYFCTEAAAWQSSTWKAFSQQTFWLVIEGKAQVLLSPLTKVVPVRHDSVTVSQHAPYQAAKKWSIFFFFFYLLLPRLLVSSDFFFFFFRSFQTLSNISLSLTRLRMSSYHVSYWFHLLWPSFLCVTVYLSFFCVCVCLSNTKNKYHSTAWRTSVTARATSVHDCTHTHTHTHAHYATPKALSQYQTGPGLVLWEARRELSGHSDWGKISLQISCGQKKYD